MKTVLLYFIFTNDDNNVRMKACENGIKKSKVQGEMFSNHTISPFPSRLPGKRARTHRDMLIIEFSSQKECSRIRGKLGFLLGMLDIA